MRFGLVNHAAILAITAVGVYGTQSIANRTLSDFVLFGACHDWLFGDSVFKQIGVRFIPPRKYDCDESSRSCSSQFPGCYLVRSLPEMVVLSRPCATRKPPNDVGGRIYDVEGGRGSGAMGSHSARGAIFPTNSPAPNKLKFPPSYSLPVVLAEAEVAEDSVKPKTTEVSVGGGATGGGIGSPVPGAPRQWVVIMCFFDPLVQQRHTP